MGEKTSSSCGTRWSTSAGWKASIEEQGGVTMAQAWQVRESERQRLLERLMHKVLDEEERRGSPHAFCLELAQCILQKLRGGASFASMHTVDIELYVYYVNEVSVPLRMFARSPTETRALLATFLLRHLLPSALSPIYSDLGKEEHENPKKMFGAERATDEVRLTEEEED
ncbi:MAG: hypothetical protein HY460_01605 [Parcubacteria group bacterium]|nr:hypothetical protein [Parcubacteria group bacterium]